MVLFSILYGMYLGAIAIFGTMGGSVVLMSLVAEKYSQQNTQEQPTTVVAEPEKSFERSQVTQAKQLRDPDTRAYLALLLIPFSVLIGLPPVLLYDTLSRRLAIRQRSRD